ncbi:hypothetical protein D3C71_1740270 [compost metagenome]
MAWNHQPVRIVGADGRGSAMHAARLLGVMRPRTPVSAAAAACASMGGGLEVGLADPRSASDLGIGSDGRCNDGDSCC